MEEEGSGVLYSSAVPDHPCRSAWPHGCNPTALLLSTEGAMRCGFSPCSSLCSRSPPSCHILPTPLFLLFSWSSVQLPALSTAGRMTL